MIEFSPSGAGLPSWVSGVDPGLTGAVAFLCADKSENTLMIFDVPVIDKTVVDGASLARLFRQYSPLLTVVEKGASRPYQSSQSTFTFGYLCGVIDGVLEATNSPFIAVSPRAWKAAYKLTSDKGLSLKIAAKLFPDLSRSFQNNSSHNQAEAALLAHYAKNHALGRTPCS